MTQPSDLAKHRRLRTLDTRARALFARRPDLAGPYTEDQIRQLVEDDAMPRPATGRPRGRPRKPHGRLTLRMPLEMLEALKADAAAVGTSVSRFCLDILTQARSHNGTPHHTEAEARTARKRTKP